MKCSGAARSRTEGRTTLESDPKRRSGGQDGSGAETLLLLIPEAILALIDALSSAVAMKVNCDLQLTFMASSLYRLLGSRLGNGYQLAKADHIFRDFVDASPQVSLTGKDLLVRFQK